ncbi:MAG: FAD-binding protein [Negativicutes bacterium]|nr:FAD-binding protein [Negativicutes bacterium]
MKISERYGAEVMVIGAGSAGMRAALAAAEAGAKVLLLNKGPLAKSGITLTAAGGMQVPSQPGDSQELYWQDTIRSGYGLADENLVWAMAEDAVARAADAERYGARFVRDADGNLAIGRFPGQSQPRNRFFKGGGIGLVTALAGACRRNNIIVMDEILITGLLRTWSGSDGAVAGAIGLNLRTGQLVRFDARSVILATGGCQWLWEVNDCPADATGDGQVLAYRAGAELIDMEMVLFYPTVIVWPESLKGAFVHYEFLSPEILDGNVYDTAGAALLPKPLPGRDEAMRLMAAAITAGRGTAHGGVLWYVGDSPQGTEKVRKTLDTLQYNYIRSHGVDPASDRIEVAPGAHYLMGGIAINEECRTNIAGLFATPECAGNVDGANRLAGNGITATQVFGARAGYYAAQWAGEHAAAADAAEVDAELARIAAKVAASGKNARHVPAIRRKLRAAVQRYAGVSRDGEGLRRLLAVIDEVQGELAEVRVPFAGVYNQQLKDVLELDSMCETARLVAGSALRREESRGHHFRSDFPQSDDANWLKHTSVKLADGGPVYGTRPVARIGRYDNC